MSADEHPAPTPEALAGVRAGGRLGPAEHVRGRLVFAGLRAHGRRGGDDVVRVLVALNGLPYSRCGMAVSKRYGRAPARNRLRRLYREAFRLEKDRLPKGVDVLISPPRNSGEPTLAQVREALVSCTSQVAERLRRRQRPESS